MWGLNDGCAPVGRHGRAHRHRPYPSPSYFSTQSHTNKITICTQSTQRKPTVHVQSAPTHLHQITRCAPTPSPPNHAVCPYPIGVVLSIAQGWQVQRSLPWVAMQARRLPPWGLYFFPSQHNDCNHTHIGGENASRTPAPILKIKKCVYVMISASPWMTPFVLKQVILSVSPWMPHLF